jgi:hypothetical protein
MILNCLIPKSDSNRLILVDKSKEVKILNVERLMKTSFLHLSTAMSTFGVKNNVKNPYMLMRVQKQLQDFPVE